jgi:hypothetical protein
MIRKLTRKKRGERYDANHARAMAVYERVELMPKRALVCHEKSGTTDGLSFKRIGSKAARFYTPSDLKGRFKDARGVLYDVMKDGSLRRVRVETTKQP